MQGVDGARRRRGIFEGEVAWGTAILLSALSALCMLPKVTWAFFLPIWCSLFLLFVYFRGSLIWHRSQALAATDSVELYPQCPSPCGDNPPVFCKHSDYVMEGTFVLSTLTDWFGPDDGWDIRVWEVRVCVCEHVLVWIKCIGRCACVFACENLMCACVCT